MPASLTYKLLADLVLLVHFGIVLFVVGGLVLVLVGNLFGWGWVNRLWFRLAHLAAIGIVVAQSWLGVTCPLTTLESWLREQAGSSAYAGGFVQHWVQRIMFFEAPSWVFACAYTVFGLLVAGAWWRFPPSRPIPTNPPAPDDGSSGSSSQAPARLTPPARDSTFKP